MVSSALQRNVNKWGSRIIPLLLLGIVGYATWVVVVSIGVNYFINPSPDVDVGPRAGAGIAIIVVYFILLTPMALSYLRTIQVVLTNPGLVPLSKAEERKRGLRPERHNKGSSNVEKNGRPTDAANPGSSQQVDFLDRAAVYDGRMHPPPGLESFYNRDIFESEIDGLPRWCSSCNNWKPDRSHHSSEIDRCVYKMDHYCPWAAGIVSETSFKFFVQFCIYGALFCLFNLIVSSYSVAHRHNHEIGSQFDINWIIVIVLAGLFLIFCSGMAYNAVLAIFVNSTTVDNLIRRSRVHNFAVLMPSPPIPAEPILPEAVPQRHVAGSAPPPPYPTIIYPLYPPPPNSPQPRRFAILATPTGSNPYKLSSRLENLKTVMGEHPYDWFLPFRYSPCCTHRQLAFPTNSGARADASERMYKLGPVVEQMMKDAGILPVEQMEVEVDRHGKRRMRKKSSPRATEKLPSDSNYTQ